MLSTISQNRKSQFDWEGLVRQNKPGPETAAQRARLESLPRLVAALGDWANHHNIATNRAEVSAYAAVVALPVALPFETALLMAQYTLWAFDVDDYVDRKDYAQFNQTNPHGWLNYFDAQFCQITEALYAVGGLMSEQGQAYGLGQRIARMEYSKQAEVISLNLGAALQDIFGELKKTWNCSDIADFRLTNFTEQAAQMLGMFRIELIANFAYQRSGKLPTLEEYLNRSKFSIGIHTVAAIVAGLEAAPEASWYKAQAALDSAAKIVRLANDLGNYWAELEEGKVNSLIIALTNNGIDPMNLQLGDNGEINEATKPIQTRLEVEISRFALEVVLLADGPLAYWLQNTVAFAIAMYQKGNYVKPV